MITEEQRRMAAEPFKPQPGNLTLIFPLELNVQTVHASACFFVWFKFPAFPMSFLRLLMFLF